LKKEFLNEREATDYYVEKSEFAETIKALEHRSIYKVFPGRRFVLYQVMPDGALKIYAALRANVITMDSAGLCILFKDVLSFSGHTRIGYKPTPIPAQDGRAAFLAIPTRCQLERTLRRGQYSKEVSESLAAGIMVWQESDPKVVGNEGAIVFSTYEEFQNKTKRSISALED